MIDTHRPQHLIKEYDSDTSAFVDNEVPEALPHHIEPSFTASNNPISTTMDVDAQQVEQISNDESLDFTEGVSQIITPSQSKPTSPSTTAEIDQEELAARLEKELGSTQDFTKLFEERIATENSYEAGKNTHLMWGSRTDVGCVRSHNEDSYLVRTPLFCVSDGMGGHAAGEVASSITVNTVARMMPSSPDAALLGHAIEAANTAVIEAAKNGLGKPGMGCTCTCAYFENDVMAIAHVGDSRAYLLHEGALIRITHDHSYVEELVEAGQITADEARVHPQRSVITRALGSDPNMYADHFTLNVSAGDRIILCSDGLSGMIYDRDIEDIAVASKTPQMCADNLVDAALAAGGSDNVTVIVVDVVDDGRLAETRAHHRMIATRIISASIIALILTLGIGFWSVKHSVYLGIKDEAVAIYTGIPDDFLGLELNWLEDETSVLISDLPEDTQKRLEAGIELTSIEEAQDTVSAYREQIDTRKAEELSRQNEISNAVEQPIDPNAQTPAEAIAAADGAVTN